MERSVPSDAKGPRLPCDGLSHSLGPHRGDLGERERGATAALREHSFNRFSDLLHYRGRTSPGETSNDCAGAPGKAWAAVAVSIVCPAPRDERGEGAASVAVELRENVVEQDERASADSVGERPRFREHECENSDSLFALRSVAAEVTPARLEPYLVEMRPAPVSPRSRSRDRRCSYSIVVAGSPSYESVASPRPSLPRTLRTAGAISPSASSRAATSCEPSDATASVHGARPRSKRRRSRGGEAQHSAGRRPRRTRSGGWRGRETRDRRSCPGTPF